MLHDLPLITTIAAALTAAWVLGLLTQRLRLSPIVGYLLAGVVDRAAHARASWATPTLAAQLAEIGVILLMFGVGLHFHLERPAGGERDRRPRRDRSRASCATLLGVGVGLRLRLAGRARARPRHGDGRRQHGRADARAGGPTSCSTPPHGHVAVGWLIVEDILTVVVLVLIPAARTPAAAPRPAGSLLASLAPGARSSWPRWSALVLLAGSRVIPWVLELRGAAALARAVHAHRAGDGDRGRGRLASMSSARRWRWARSWPAWWSGSRRSASRPRPTRCRCATRSRCCSSSRWGCCSTRLPAARAAAACWPALAIVLIGKPLAALAIVAVLGYSARTALTVAPGPGADRRVLVHPGATSARAARAAAARPGTTCWSPCAIVSITLNPLLFRRLRRASRRWLRGAPRAVAPAERARASGAGPINAHGRRAGRGEPAAAGGDRRLRAGRARRSTGCSADGRLRDGRRRPEHGHGAGRSRPQGRRAIYGDASTSRILKQAGVAPGRAPGHHAAALGQPRAR